MSTCFCPLEILKGNFEERSKLSAVQYALKLRERLALDISSVEENVEKKRRKVPTTNIMLRLCAPVSEIWLSRLYF